MKSKFMIIGVLILSAAMMTTGVLAYFSDDVAITGSTISAGDLEIQLSNDGSSWGDTAQAWQMENIAPGDFVEQTIYMRNAGTVVIGQVRHNWTNLVETKEGADLAKQLIIVDIQDNADGGVNQTSNLNAAGIVTLYDLAKFGPGSPGWDTWSSLTLFPYLPVGGTGWLYMKLQFNPLAGNNFENSAVTYNLFIEALQQKVYN